MSAVLQQAAPGYRTATTDDLNQIVAIENRAYPHPWSRNLLKDCMQGNYYFCVMVVEEQIIGYGILSCVLDEAHLLNICIDPEWQGRRYGKQLLSHLEDIARKHRARTFFLEVRLSNVAAQQMYETSGFNQISSRRAYYPKGVEREDALIYAKAL